jgi:hypothetical protein
MLETLGLIISALGIAFAFETPRKWLIYRFRKTPDIEHQLKVRVLFYAHNDAHNLGPLGSNKIEKKYQLLWTAKNNSSHLVQIERGIFMRRASAGLKSLLLTPPEFTTKTTILPKHTHFVLQLELTPSQVEHYRHWVRECNAFGLQTTAGEEYWVPSEQFIKFGTDLQNIAFEYGLPDSVPEGKMIVMKIEHNIK